MQKKKYEVYENDKLVGIYTADEAAALIGVGMDAVRHSVSKGRKLKDRYTLIEQERELSAKQQDRLRKWFVDNDWEGVMQYVRAMAEDYDRRNHMKKGRKRW